jgi:hypothetical protein
LIRRSLGLTTFRGLVLTAIIPLLRTIDERPIRDPERLIFKGAAFLLGDAGLADEVHTLVYRPQSRMPEGTARSLVPGLTTTIVARLRRCQKTPTRCKKDIETYHRTRTRELIQIQRRLFLKNLTG